MEIRERERLERRKNERLSERPGDAMDHALWVTKHIRPDRSGALRYDDARNLLRRCLQLYSAEYSLRIHAWACLPSRVDLVIGLPSAIPVKDAMADVFGYFTRRYNTRYGKSGALVRTKFVKRNLLGSLAIQRGIEVVSQIPANMNLRARPGGEVWSSAAFYETGEADLVVTPYLPSGRATLQLVPDPEVEQALSSAG